VLCAIILSLCGVDDDVVAAEYVLTEQGLAEWKTEILPVLLKSPAFRDDPEAATRMLGSR